MKRKFKFFLGSILFTVGIGCLIYPEFYQKKIEKKMEHIEQSWLKEIPEEKEEVEYMKYKDLYKKMKDYNKRLEKEGQSFEDFWSYEEPAISLKELPYENYMVGTIEIPDMEVKLPLFLGASKEHLSEGAGILSETSMPIGGENTNCVIAAHRGWKGIPYFQHIDQLSPGSKIYIKNFWETRIYQVIESKIIEPWNIDEIFIQKGKDMVTLLSCHPYGVRRGNKRFLVYCEYIENSEK